MIIIFKGWTEKENFKGTLSDEYPELKSTFRELLSDKQKELITAFYTYSHKTGKFEVNRNPFIPGEHTFRHADKSDLGEIPAVLGIK